MARLDDLRGYALKRSLNTVPHQYPAPHLRRGVVPPVTVGEARRFDAEAAARRTARAGAASTPTRRPL